MSGRRKAAKGNMDTTSDEILFEDLNSELEFLTNQNFVPAAVQDFKHALLLPLCRQLSDQLNAGVRIIVEFVYSRCGPFYWPCRVLNFEGYYVLLKFESADDNSQSFWSHLVSGRIFPVGYSMEHHIQLRKPENCSIGKQTTKVFLAGCYFGKPSTFPSRLRDILRGRLTKLKFTRPVVNPQKVLFFKKGMQLEVRDPECPSDYYLGRVRDIVGTRVEVKYNFRGENNKLWRETVWCDTESDAVQPCGWCKAVGHSILCDDTYSPNELDTAGSKYKNFDYGNIEIGQQLEVIDPLDRSQLYLATVTKLLKFGYIMIRAEVGPEEAYNEFCVHLSSPEIFPLGFADRNQIERAKPESEAQVLSPVPELLLQNLREPSRRHCFDVNMKLEASEWYFERNKQLDPSEGYRADGNLIFLATVTRIVSDGNCQLLRIGYKNDEGGYNEQWLATSSCDIYPVGYTELPGLVNEEEEFTYASEALTRSDAMNKLAAPNLPLNSVGDCRNTMDAVTADRALNPLEWTCKELKQFLQLNNYWGSRLLKDILPDSIDGKTLTSCTEIDVRRMVEHYPDARSRSSCSESLVNLINYLRVLHWGYEM